jgi:hypothetical protein
VDTSGYEREDPYWDGTLGGDGVVGDREFIDQIQKPTASGYYSCGSSVGCGGRCDPESTFKHKVCTSLGYQYSYLYKGIAGVPSNGNSETYISAAKYLNNFTTSAINKDAGLSAMKRSCTVNPTVTYSAGYFPVRSEGDSTPTMYFKDVNLNFSSSTESKRPIVMDGGDLHVYRLTQYNSLTVKGGKVSGSYLTATGDVTLTASKGTTPTYTVGSSFFQTAKTSGVLTGKFTSTGYNINVNDIYFSVGATATSSEVAKITLGDGGTLKTYKNDYYGLHIYPSSDAKASSFNSYVSIIGPNSGETAKVYSNLHVGNKEYDWTPSAKGFQIKFSGNLSYEMIDGYNVTLAPNCSINAIDYGPGYTSKINWSTSGKAWKICYTDSTIWEPYNYHEWLSCDARWKTATAGDSFTKDGTLYYKYFITSINASSSRTLSYGGYHRHKKADCGMPSLDIRSSEGKVCYSGCKNFIWCE